MELINQFFTFLLLYVFYITGYSCTCYFPIEYQGTFMMQASPSSSSSLSLSSGLPLTSSSSLPSLVSSQPSTVPTTSGGSVGGVVIGEVTYSELTIEADAIPPWGSCHKREGSNVILKDGTENCMRCFHLSLKTSNILQIHSSGLSRCYTTEEAARATCPTDKTIKENKSTTTEFILFRKHIPEETVDAIEKVFCPVNGRYKFTYTSNNGRIQCNSYPSDLSNCPKGNILSARFRKCQAIPDQEIQFQCLGDWDNPYGGGDRYIALMDLSVEPKNRPKYRCGLYRENATTGQVFVSLSADSTCSTSLINAKYGYETLTLTPMIPEKIVTRPYSFSSSESVKCRFPDWTQGKWDRARVEGNQFKFKDAVNNYRTLTSKCIVRQTNTPNDRFIVHSTTQCGESFYTCVWMKFRSTNILEFQFGSKSSPNFLGNLCDDQQFPSKNWITQGRKIVSNQTPCPITGDYHGILPVETGLCAKVSSDCNNPDVMFHSVSSCENRSHVYEEREYRCLGNWEEDGILYTFTQRRDTTGYQCFAGKILDNGEVAYIREAGENCIRGDDPTTSGMKITKQAACPRGLPQVNSYVPTRPSWQPKAEKISPPVYQKPSIPPVMKTLSSKPISAPPQYIPRPIPAMLGLGDNNPHWYQADPPAKKIFKPASITPFRPTKMRRNSGSSVVPMIWLILPLILINRFFGLTS